MYVVRINKEVNMAHSLSAFLGLFTVWAIILQAIIHLGVKFTGIYLVAVALSYLVSIKTNLGLFTLIADLFVKANKLSFTLVYEITYNLLKTARV